MWGTNHKSEDFNSIFKLQKKAIRIVTNKTAKVNKIFVNTKPLFQMTSILNIHNLYFYLTAAELHRILSSNKPIDIFNQFDVSPRSHRILLPKFNKEKYKSNSFVFNSSKIINYFVCNKISHFDYTNDTYKLAIKRHLLTRQSLSLNNDPNWLPYNLSIFSDVNM